MVVWVFAGGGETEVQSLIPFLEKNFNCKFQRKTPARRKPGPKPGVKTTAYGRTGQGLINQISQELPIALKNEPKVCSLILVFDDLEGYHTPSLLLEIQPSQLMGKCPLFRRFYTDLQSFCK
ncbi:hypothetical protein [Cylindrospermopsis raciborskii]|jgi:hypothetical protein|uniref:hypothetical protein n=1 Tax=Cylindrospermopsis raciborskii TaxID=77022 RepID=UPI000E1EB70A|nr:hypothetical protein [Cylindrospermopsis raciborskii]UJL33081.1 hypothetical protein C6N34_013180 [Cylindrospermopsis raciborskii Cr2010]